MFFSTIISSRMRSVLCSVIGIVAAFPCAGQVVDTGKGDQVLRSILAPIVGQKVCFSRTYDRAHLLRHSKQQVTGMAFELRYAQVPGIETRRYEFGMSVRLRTKPHAFYTTGICETNVDPTYPGANLRVVDCDGGGASIEKVANADALYLHLDTPAAGIALGRVCDAELRGNAAGVRVEPGADDKLFRLDRVAITACKDLERLRAGAAER